MFDLNSIKFQCPQFYQVESLYSS